MAFCNKCGIQIDGESSFCHSCGSPAIKTENNPLYNTEPVNEAAIPDPSKTVVQKKSLYGVVNLENLPEGHVIEDRYIIKSKLGQGGFGAVYRVYDQKMEIDKALKILPESVLNDREAMEGLRKEAKTMARLNHPGIIRIFEFHEKGSIKYIDMEFVDGKEFTDLKLDRLEKKLDESVVKKYAVQIAKALAYAHSEGVIHKDIKPQNILVSKKNQVKIMDFGISETMRGSMSRIANSVSAGTLLYMAPEQIQGVDVGKEADIYSFGAMLYELIDGKPPFHQGDISYQILNKLPPNPDGASKPFNELIQKCLAKDYKDRFRDFTEVLNVLEGQKQNKTVTSPTKHIPQIKQYTHSASKKTASQHIADINQRPVQTLINYIYSAVKSKTLALMIVCAACASILLLPFLIYYTGVFSKDSPNVEFVYIEPGTFTMGSPLTEVNRSEDETQHDVTFSYGFFMQTTEVTQGQWEEVMKYNDSNNSAMFKKRSDHPVENINMTEIQGFIDKLNTREDGWSYRLPTEAEWEYACRAGSTAPYAGTSDLNDMGWFNGNTTWFKNLFSETYPVAKKSPNAFGLFDMHGNVWELCQDLYGPYPEYGTSNPQGPKTGNRYVRRGGSWLNGPERCRTASRDSIATNRGYRYLGFRLVRF